LQVQSPPWHVAPPTSETAVPSQSLSFVQPPTWHVFAAPHVAVSARAVRVSDGQPPSVFSAVPAVQAAPYAHWLFVHVQVVAAQVQYVW
jgi:hypothetical protein